MGDDAAGAGAAPVSAINQFFRHVGLRSGRGHGRHNRPPVVLEPVVTDPPPAVVPALVWPNAEGAWVEALRPSERVALDAVGDCVVIQHGQLIGKFGQWDRPSGLWSSCVRTWRTLMVLQAIREGRISREALWRPAGPPFPTADVLLVHVLSRTSNAKPPGSAWRYSGGSHWPWQHEVVERLTGESREQQAERLASAVVARLTWDRDPDDTTQRIDGSPYEMAKLGLLMLRNGQWRDRVVFDADLWQKAIGRDLTDNPHPLETEGWQVHLVRQGRHTESGTRPPMRHVSDQAYFAAGGTNRGYVFVDPATDLVIARVRRQGIYIDEFVPDLIDALGI